MKYLPLIWGGLWRKPLRTTLTFLSLVVAFVLFGLLQGINAGFDYFVATSHMDRMWVDSRFGAPMPMSYKDQIASMPGVKTVSVQSFMGGTIGGDPKKRFFVGFGVDGFFDYFTGFDITPQKLADLRANRMGFIVSKESADRWGFKVGDRVHMHSDIPKRDGSMDWEFELIGIVERPDLPGVYGISVGNYEYFNDERTKDKDTIDEFLVVMSDPGLSVATAKAIDKMFLNSTVPTKTTVEKLAIEDDRSDDTTPKMVNAIVLSVMFALLVMTTNSLMNSFRERIPEFGTLKALGFDDRRVAFVVLAEALAQCVAGAMVGLLIARLATPYVKRLLSGPSGFISVRWSLFAMGLLVACVVALISAALPAWRAVRMQIVNALAVK